MEDFSEEIFTIKNTIQEYNRENLVGTFFEDEIVRYDLPEFYEIDVIKIKGRGKKKENLNYQIQIIISDQVLWSNIWGN